MYNFCIKKCARKHEIPIFVPATENIDFLHKKADGLLTVYFVQIKGPETVQMYQEIVEKYDFQKFSRILHFKNCEKSDFQAYFCRFLKIISNYLWISIKISK